jgi:hypothetical protein
VVDAELRPHAQPLPWLKLEFNSWELLKRMHQHEQEVCVVDMPADTDFDNAEGAVDAYLHCDKDRQRMRIILQWLEECAVAPERREAPDSAHRRMWKWTQNDDPRAASFDPDAPQRDGLQLHPDDDEGAFLSMVWQYVRRGDQQAALRLCEDWGQPWRAASLLGGEFGSAEQALAGNSRRELWKSVCWELSDGDGGGAVEPVEGHEAEEAIYATMAGNVDRLLGSRLCASWEDQAWAFFRTCHDRHVDDALAHLSRAAELRSRGCPGSRSSALGAARRQLQERTAQAKKLRCGDIVKRVEQWVAQAAASAPPPPPQQQGQLRRHHEVQQWLMRPWHGGQLQALIDDVLLRECCGAPPTGAAGDYSAHATEFLRFAAHVVLYNAVSEGRRDAEGVPYVVDEAGQDVLSAHVTRLIELRHVNLAALYCRSLTVPRRKQLYVELLQKCHAEEREGCLNEGFRCLPEQMNEILERVVDLVWGNLEMAPAAGGELWAGAHGDSLANVNAVMWFCYPGVDVPNAPELPQRSQAKRDMHLAALQRSNKLCRLLARKQIDAIVDAEACLGAMRHLFSNILPFSDIEGDRAEDHWKPADFPEMAPAVAEHGCWRMYLDAQMAFHEWCLSLAAVGRSGGGGLDEVEQRLSVAHRSLLHVLVRMPDHFLCADPALNASQPRAYDAAIPAIGDVRRACVRHMVKQLHEVRACPAAPPLGIPALPPLSTMPWAGALTPPTTTPPRCLCPLQLYFNMGECILKRKQAVEMQREQREQAIEMFTHSLNISQLVATEHHRLYNAYSPRDMQDLLALMHRSKLAILQCEQWEKEQARR